MFVVREIFAGVSSLLQTFKPSEILRELRHEMYGGGGYIQTSVGKRREAAREERDAHRAKTGFLLASEHLYVFQDDSTTALRKNARKLFLIESVIIFPTGQIIRRETKLSERQLEALKARCGMFGGPATITDLRHPEPVDFS